MADSRGIETEKEREREMGKKETERKREREMEDEAVRGRCVESTNIIIAENEDTRFRQRETEEDGETRKAGENRGFFERK